MWRIERAKDYRWGFWRIKRMLKRKCEWKEKRDKALDQVEQPIVADFRLLSEVTYRYPINFGKGTCL